MKPIFSQQEVLKIARLSALELSDKEAQAFSEQFSSILDYFKILKVVDISIMSNDVDEKYLSGVRDDMLKISEVTPEHFSPHLDRGFFKVPRVIDHSD